MSTDEVDRMTSAPVQGLPQSSCGCRLEVGAAPPECWMRSAPDRERLGHACAVLRHYGIVAYPALGPQDAATTRERIAASMLADFPDWDGAFVFWTDVEDERCIGHEGMLRRPLLAHVGGTAIETSLRGALELVGLETAPGPVPGTLMVTGR
jgi:hypothetical protein